MVTYPSLDFTSLYITLAKTINVNNEAYGVGAIDVDTSFLPSIFSNEELSKDHLKKGADIILITEIEDIVLYSYKQAMAQEEAEENAQDIKVSLFEKEK